MPTRNLSAAFWVPAQGGRDLEIELPTELDRPDVGSSGESKTKRHQPLDSEDVIQYLGPSARSYSISGAIFPRHESVLERYTMVPRIKARLPDRGTLDLVVESYDISPQRTKFRIPENIRGQYPDDKQYRFLKEFTLEAIEFREANLSDEGSAGGRSSNPQEGQFSEDSPYDSSTNQAPDTPSSF